MTPFFCVLGTQATREVIINETIKYIKELEMKMQKLEELKESMKEGSILLACGNNNMNCSVTVSVSANVAFFGIQSLPRSGLVSVIMKVFCKHRAEILAANVSVNNGKLIINYGRNFIRMMIRENLVLVNHNPWLLLLSLKSLSCNSLFVFF